MKDKYVVERTGQKEYTWISGFHHNGKPTYTTKLEEAMLWTEEAACLFTMEAADAGDPNYWSSPMQVKISFGSL